MGYPMTYQRVINRNRLREGSYTEPNPTWRESAGMTAWSVVENQPKEAVINLAKSQEEHHKKRIEAVNSRLSSLLGDLRRLEADTVDEGRICKEIAVTTGLDPDDVAAVLKAWMAL